MRKGALCFLERERAEAACTSGLQLSFPFLPSHSDTFLGRWLFPESQTGGLGDSMVPAETRFEGEAETITYREQEAL